jgi:hypothetical protein
MAPAAIRGYFWQVEPPDDATQISHWVAPMAASQTLYFTFSNNTLGFYTLCSATGTLSQHVFFILDTAFSPQGSSYPLLA